MAIFTPTTELVAIDISAFTGEHDYISLSCPEFPNAINLSQSFVDFTSNSEGIFGVDPDDHIAFNEATFSVQLYPDLTLFPEKSLFPEGEVSGNTEMRLPIHKLENVDKSSITAIRIRVTPTAECVFRCLSIRACSEKWLYAPVDLDTLWNRVHRPPSPDGAKEPSVYFPEVTESPKAFPYLFRSGSLTGVSDPMPVDLSVGVEFHTGSLTLSPTSSKNAFALIFRDVPTDNQTQIELGSMTQGQLEAYDGQPDFGRALFDSRVQEEVDVYGQSNLDERSQFNIERIPDNSEHTWLKVSLDWGNETATNSVTIHDADEVGYTFTGMALEATSPSNLDHGVYWLKVDLQDSTIRVRIYQLNQVGELISETPVFDSGSIYNDNLIKRRKGRFGWYTSLLDGDAHIDNIRTRGANYGELVSKEFRSITPVKGASLYAGSTADHELIDGIESTDVVNTTLTLDAPSSSSGKAIKVSVSPLQPLQGIQTNEFIIDDPRNLRISFDLKFPSSEIPGGGLSAFLKGKFDVVYPINLSSFQKGIWTHIKADLQEELFQSGMYRFVLLQTLPVVTTSWWIDNLSAKTFSVKWSARPHKSDAWNTEGGRWLDAGFTLNSLNGGIVFDELGSGLQIRAEVLRQDAMITDFKAVPQYATLGRRVYLDESTEDTSSPAVVTIEHHTSSRTVSFKTTGGDSNLVTYLWDFGDGFHEAGKNPVHTYTSAGTYGVVLTTKDSFGNMAAASASITVT